MTELEKITQYAEQFGVDIEWAVLSKERYLRQQLERAKEYISHVDLLILECSDRVAIVLLTDITKAWEKKIQGLQYRVKHVRDTSVSGNTLKITPEIIEQARSYPIEELIGLEKGKYILCPFHDDHRPSAAIKNNRLHCFVCNKTWNPIDYLMEKEELKFIDAIKRLI